jgi:hypothetical protein
MGRGVTCAEPDEDVPLDEVLLDDEVLPDHLLPELEEDVPNAAPDDDVLVVPGEELEEDGCASPPSTGASCGKLVDGCAPSAQATSEANHIAKSGYSTCLIA